MYGYDEHLPYGATSETWVDYVEDLMPVAASIGQELANPYRMVEVYAARLENCRARGLFPSYCNVVEGKLRAAQQRLALEEEEEESDRAFRKAGQTAVWMSAIAGGALTIMLIAGTFRLAARRRK